MILSVILGYLTYQKKNYDNYYYTHVGESNSIAKVNKITGEVYVFNTVYGQWKIMNK
jgi:hypothetical protein